METSEKMYWKQQYWTPDEVEERLRAGESIELSDRLTWVSNPAKREIVET